MRQIDWDESGPLVWKRRYRPFRDRKNKIGEMQKLDYNIISEIIGNLGLKGKCLLESEWPDYIEDFDGKRTSKGRVRLQQVYFDLVMFYKDTVIIFESDDRSHYDKQYCISQGWDFTDIQRRDRIKDIWAKKTDTLLIRIPEHHLSNNGTIGKPFTEVEKKSVIMQIIKNIRDAKNCT